jgi:hypothetical protein
LMSAHSVTEAFPKHFPHNLINSDKHSSLRQHVQVVYRQHGSSTMACSF